MATGKLPQSALSLKQFFLRRQVLSLYREILRTLREVPNEDHRKELADWARTEFKKNKNENDEWPERIHKLGLKVAELPTFAFSLFLRSSEMLANIYLKMAKIVTFNDPTYGEFNFFGRHYNSDSRVYEQVQ